LALILYAVHGVKCLKQLKDLFSQEELDEFESLLKVNPNIRKKLREGEYKIVPLDLTVKR
jgi:hypothetical protein